MEGGNHVLRQGKISRWPLIALLSFLLIAAIAAFLSLGEVKDKDDHLNNKLSDETPAMIEQGNKLLKQLSSEREQELLIASQKSKDVVTPKETDPAELRAKAQVLNEEAKQALEYADELEGIDGNNFKQDYENYLQKSEPSVPARKVSPPANNQDESFAKVLSAPTRLKLFDKQESQPNAQIVNSKTSPSYENGETKDATHTLNDYAVFNRNDDFTLGEVVRKPQGKLCLRQGNLIPAMLLTAINSDLPGLVSAQTTADVLDSIYGKEVLIPKGTRITGEYAAGPGYGQERVFIAFKRLLFPDGSTLNLGAMPGQTTDGRAGFDASVNNHLFGVLSSALLLSAVSAGVSSSQSYTYDAQGRIHYQDALANAASASLGNTLGKIIEKNLNLSPTLNVKPGYAFSVCVAKDIFFNAPWGNPNFAID